VVVPEPKDSLQEAFSRAVSGSPWRRLRRGGRAVPAVAVVGATVVVLTLLGVAAAASHDPGTSALAEAPPTATAAATGPASVPPRARPPARPVPHAAPGPTAPAGGEGAALPGPPPAAPPPPDPAEQSAREQPVTVTSVPLSMGGGLTATLYVGQLDPLLRRLDGSVTFHTGSGFRAQRPRLCVATVVIEGVSGTTAAVYAQGLGSGWGGAEDVPDQRVAADGGTVHQQLVTPPPAATAGASWTGSAALHVDGELVGESGEYRLTVEAVAGSVWQWRAGDRPPVECRAY
jgi:hypothetical protein